MELPDQPGAIAQVVDVIASLGRNIGSLVPLRGEDETKGAIVARIEGVALEVLRARLTDLDDILLDIRSCG